MSFDLNSNFKAPLFNPPPKPTLDVDQANKAKLQGEVTSTQFPVIGNQNTPFQEIKPLPPGIIGGQFPIKVAAPFDFPTQAVTQALQTISNRFGKRPPQLQGQPQVAGSNTEIGFAPSPNRPVTLDMLTQALRTNLLGRKGAPILIALIQNYNDILKLAPEATGTKPVFKGLTPAIIQAVAKRDGRPSRFSLSDIRIQNT
ncbi:MAG: hypothetical protein K2X66_12455, partial [Cyanobacteria bacterium]|nr:hypothetical protein [Cyanobacteriota bacterium]